MKTKYFIATVILLFAGSIFYGCETKNQNIEDAKDNVKDAKQELKDAQAQYESDLALLEQSIDIYQESFNAIVEAYQRKGFDEEADFESEFRTAARNIEAKIYGQAGLEKLIITFLEIRTSEKNYLADAEPVSYTHLSH